MDSNWNIVKILGGTDMEIDENEIMEIVENNTTDSKKLEMYVSLKLKQIAEEVEDAV